MIKVFFDASVLFSGFYSPTGASRALLELVKKNFIYGLTSQTVIDELEDNLYKFSKQINIDSLIEEYSILIREKITVKEIEPYKTSIEEKDQHVVTGAVLTGCQYLVTLDKKHLDNQKIKENITKIKIISPKELLNKIL